MFIVTEYAALSDINLNVLLIVHCEVVRALRLLFFFFFFFFSYVSLVLSKSMYDDKINYRLLHLTNAQKVDSAMQNIKLSQRSFYTFL